MNEHEFGACPADAEIGAMRLPTTTPISASLTMIPGAIRLRNKSISLAFLGSNGHDNRGCRNEQPQRSARPLRAARGARNRGREWNGDHVKAVMSQCSHLVSNQSRRQTAQRQQRHGSAGQDSARPGLSVGWWLSVGRARTQRSGLSGAEILGGGSAGGSHPHHVARVRTGTGGWCRGAPPPPRCGNEPRQQNFRSTLATAPPAPAVGRLSPSAR
jgi:hypothetical protein